MANHRRGTRRHRDRLHRAIASAAARARRFVFRHRRKIVEVAERIGVELGDRLVARAMARRA